MATLVFIKSALLTLSIDAGTPVEYQGDVQDVHVEVSPGDIVTYPTLDGKVASNTGKETYSLVMAGAQDYTATGLARFLWDNKGKIADVVVNHHGQTATATDATPAIVGKVSLVPVQYGGAVEEFAEFEVTLAFTEEPVLDAGTPAP